MGLVKIGNRRVQYDLAVDVPYEKTAKGDVTFYLRWVPVTPRTETAPQEGGHWEVVADDGTYFDDDGPDLEDEAYVRADEIMDRYGFEVILGYHPEYTG